jgi:hypothetical protein
VNLGGEEEIAIPDPFLASFNGFCTSPGRHWRKPGSPVPSKLGYHLFGVGSGEGWQEAKMVQALTQRRPHSPGPGIAQALHFSTSVCLVWHIYLPDVLSLVE